ncbi:hypothetical protein [Legionella qingyii]|uniref:hypothetical protein n=1 Tax=Legionella qingyii TaxID=2184757 RepID=UPI000F8DA240|nr:hypothetical protein [Legionella qingyii]RUR21953.1 hypothetical protein ELY16_15565 [Legionella qingyii]
MSLYQIIANQLSQAGLHYEEQQLEKMDIIEYMVLEAAGVLHPLQGMSLKCVFSPGHKGTLYVSDGKKHSSLEFGLVPNLQEPSISEEKKKQFIQIVNGIVHKVPKSTSIDAPRHRHGTPSTFCEFIIPDENIEQAIKSSSLFVATGDLSELDLESLLLLKRKLFLYVIYDKKLSELVLHLLDKVDNHLSEHFDQASVQKALPKVGKKFAAMLATTREEHKFYQLLNELSDKLYELTRKATKTYESGAPNDPPIVNNNFDPNYSSVALTAQLLNSNLVDAGAQFFNNPMSKNSFEAFKSTCDTSIKSAKGEFGKFRGWAKWYNELNPILKSIIVCIKAIGGIIAGLTIIPGVLTEIYSKQGYLGTFFNTKTDSLRKLETFEENLFSKGGIFDGLDKEIPHLGITI